MKIISLSGVDGSGKSTQAQLLQAALVTKGKKVAYFHATEFSLANRLHRQQKSSLPFTPGSTPAVTNASLGAVLLRIFFLAIDGVRFAGYRRSLARQGIDYLISDRFFQDSLINILYLSQNPVVRLKVLFLSWVLPKPDQAFFLDVSATAILSRGRVPEQGAGYLETKIALYQQKFEPWHYTVIDGARAPEVIAQDIFNRL